MHRSPGGGGGGLFLPVQRSLIHCDLGQVCLRGVFFANAWWYHLVRTVYAPLKSAFPFAGSKNVLISSAAFSGIHLDSTRRDLRTDLVIMRNTLLVCRELQWREEISSISRIDVYWGCGGQVSGDGVGSSSFSS